MNSWREPSRSDIQPSSVYETVDHPVEAPDLPTLPPSEFDATPQPHPEAEPVKLQILDEFGPLASQEEKAAKETWEPSESHPPPPPPLQEETPKPHCGKDRWDKSKERRACWEIPLIH
jgi:Rab5 GDP/GTP exchange factor